MGGCYSWGAVIHNGVGRAKGGIVPLKNVLIFHIAVYFLLASVSS